MKKSNLVVFLFLVVTITVCGCSKSPEDKAKALMADAIEALKHDKDVEKSLMILQQIIKEYPQTITASEATMSINKIRQMEKQRLQSIKEEVWSHIYKLRTSIVCYVNKMGPSETGGIQFPLAAIQLADNKCYDKPADEIEYHVVFSREGGPTLIAKSKAEDIAFIKEEGAETLFLTNVDFNKFISKFSKHSEAAGLTFWKTN